MYQADADLLLRIDAFLGLLGFTLVITMFYLMIVNIIISLICFVTVILAAGAGIKGYRKSRNDAASSTA